MSSPEHNDDWKRHILENMQFNPEFEVEDISSTDTSSDHPAMYEVVLLNDDFTPFDFVIYVLQRFFHNDDIAAASTTLKIHNEGQGICGLYTREVAETKVLQVVEFARNNNYPLKCIMQKSESYAIKKS